MITLKEVTENEKNTLWNVNQKYLYEMTQYYPDEMDENGNYQYGYFDCYFTEPERKAYFILDDTVLVGFAMLNPYSYIEHHPDMVIAEFCIFPSYRRKHIASEAAQMILDLYSGNWEIKFNERNTGAKKLWEKVTARYMPDVYHINDDETVLEFSNK